MKTTHSISLPEEFVSLEIPMNHHRRQTREVAYFLFTSKRAADANWPARPDYFCRRNSWSGIPAPFYASANERWPEREPSAKTGLCIVVNVSGPLGKLVRSIVRKYVPAESQNARVNFWFARGSFTPDDFKRFVATLKAIEEDFNQAGLI